MTEEKLGVGGYFLSNIKYALNLLSKKWTLDIIMVLCGDSLRFSEIEKYLSGISPKILSERLAELQEFDLIHKEVEVVTPLKIRYTLTPKGLQILRTLSGFSRVGSKLRKEVE